VQPGCTQTSGLRCAFPLRQECAEVSKVTGTGVSQS
jgi:hypothetical protein